METQQSQSHSTVWVRNRGLKNKRYEVYFSGPKIEAVNWEKSCFFYFFFEALVHWQKGEHYYFIRLNLRIFNPSRGQAEGPWQKQNCIFTQSAMFIEKLMRRGPICKDIRRDGVATLFRAPLYIFARNHFFFCRWLVGWEKCFNLMCQSYGRGHYQHFKEWSV